LKRLVRIYCHELFCSLLEVYKSALSNPELKEKRVMTPFQHVIWVFVLMLVLSVVWMIFRATHGFTSYRKIRNVFRVFRQMHLADNILRTARHDSKKRGCLAYYRKIPQQKITVAKNYADSVRHPALVVDTSAQDNEIQGILKTGYRNEASKMIDSLHEMLEDVRIFVGAAKLSWRRPAVPTLRLPRSWMGLISALWRVPKIHPT